MSSAALALQVPRLWIPAQGRDDGDRERVAWPVGFADGLRPWLVEKKDSGRRVLSCAPGVRGYLSPRRHAFGAVRSVADPDEAAPYDGAASQGWPLTMVAKLRR